MTQMSYDNNDSGILAKNKRKEKESHPDYSGSINVNGVDYWLSGWLKVGKEGSKLAGEKFFSLALKPKDDQPAAATKPVAKAAKPVADYDDSSDVPF